MFARQANGSLYTHLLVHVALMVFPGSGGLVDFSFTMDTVIHQDETSETDAKTPVIHHSCDGHTVCTHVIIEALIQI